MGPRTALHFIDAYYARTNEKLDARTPTLTPLRYTTRQQTYAGVELDWCRSAYARIVLHSGLMHDLPVPIADEVTCCHPKLILMYLDLFSAPSQIASASGASQTCIFKQICWAG